MLTDRASELGLPKAPVRLVIQSYSCKRFMRMDSTVVDTGFNICIVAGCGFATTGVKAYCLQPLSGFELKHHAIQQEADA